MKQTFIIGIATTVFLYAPLAIAASDAYNQYLANIKAGAESGDAKAEASLGIAYQVGNGVPKDYVEAVKWLQKSADQGNATGETFLGTAYAHGHGVAMDKEKAAMWWRKAVEQGNLHAKTFLGMSYYIGSGVPRDHALSMKLLREAAEQGDGGAIDFLRTMNVPVNVQVGQQRQTFAPNNQYFSDIQTKAKTGDAKAVFALAMAYISGFGVPKNEDEGLKWLKKAADQGEPQAETFLGEYYYMGIMGLPKDQDTAMEWLDKAAAQNDKMALAFLHGLNTSGTIQDKTTQPIGKQ